jgi:predicted metalloprotease with PDZ domain
LHQLDKHRWEAKLPAGCQTLELRYQVYAFDASVRTAFLDQTRAFFNPTSLCLRVLGREDEAHALTIEPPSQALGLDNWQLATALLPLRKGRQGFGTYHAANYDELADSPVTMGPMWSGQFRLRGVPHRFVVTGAPPGFDGQRLLRDTQAICAAAMALWHGPDAPPPFDRYLFMLHASHDGYGGLEHRHSTALLCQRSDLPLLPMPGIAAAKEAGTALKASDGYTTLLGLISHEYFHTWNVKRLRPAEFARYDYDRENYTQLLWFFEGFTSYYDDLLLLRAGLIDSATYLQLLCKTIQQVQQTPGRQLQSVAQASFDAWVKYYRVQENTPNATVSYYTKGALVALCLDLTLRAEGHSTLDAVMQALYARCQGGPMRERDLLAELRRQGRRAFDNELAAWVHGTNELPLPVLLQQAGVQWQSEAAPLAQQLGLRLADGPGLRLKTVLRGSAAEGAGLAAGDEWLAVEVNGEGWRVHTLDEVARLARGQHSLGTLVARDGRLLRGTLHWPAPASSVKLLPAATGTTAATNAIGWPHA